MKLAIALFAAGLPGVVLAVLRFVPALIAYDGREPSLPMSVILLAAIAQSAILLALAVWAGASFASRVGLRTPVLSAWLEGGPVVEGRAILLAGLAGGLLGGLFIFVVDRQAPSILAGAQARVTPPLVVRVLYGGITEELLTRWGLMSLILWGAWRAV